MPCLSAALMVGMDLEGGRYFFNAVREGDSVLFASDDENECSLWVMALYRATGQSHKPTPPLTSGQNSSISKLQGDADKARKHGMEDYISADPCQFEHAQIFKLLQNLTLDYRLNDPFASMVCPVHVTIYFFLTICNYFLKNILNTGMVQSRTSICSR
jgi:calcium-dependent secretion activator